MRTYLKLILNSDGEKVSVVADSLADIGFAPSHGAHDFVYEWPADAGIDEILHFGDRIQAELQGTKCMFELETV